MPKFSHLHCHTQFSLLDGATSIDGMIAKAAADNMPAVALTDHGNMFGAFKFVNSANKSGIKPIVGCEFYLVEDRFKKQFTKQLRDKRYHQLLLAKDQAGYENLSRLCSLGYIEGLYSKYPRIDKELLRRYKDGLIATTCCIGAEVPQTILTQGEEAGELLFKEWLDLFGDDYYIELQRHNIKNINGSGLSQEDLNQILLKWSKKYNVPVIATNDSHYLEQDDFEAHDMLLCINTGELQSTPKGSGKGYRFGFENDEFYFKTQNEMLKLFEDIPEAIDNTNLIVDKITAPNLTRDVLLPNFVLPQGFNNQDDYLRNLTIEGARRKYGELTLEVMERIDYELAVIKNIKFPGYFLIVQDFTNVARELGVSVGPGRGSAAGSVVAYCTGITNVDPIKYKLLFERFLNPDRISLPDIDIDFDDEGRQRVIDYVVDKYGKEQVAQIITYGSMAAKSSLRDVGRVMDVPLSEVTTITKVFPDNLSASINKIVRTNGIDPSLKSKLSGDQLQQAEQFKALAEGDTVIGKMIQNAKKLEGSVRNTGVHACGVIIAPTNLIDLIPLSTAKDSDLLLTQFDNAVVEDAGLLKMDFLGLKNLSIIKDAVLLINKNYPEVNLDIEELGLEDAKTYELFQKGETNALFQFESPGMQKHLKELKPNKFEDLIAMNALYRPGPMQYIPSFCKRKNGTEKISYDLPQMEEFLSETYGITVYQEQVMLLSQKLANFTKGEADTLRKAMGKKKRKLIDEMFPKFEAGCEANNIPKEKIEKIWKDWEKFASYAFNKSHSTCYALIAYQTGYLKANYPAEYMAAVLTHCMRDIKKVSFYLEECKRMRLTVLGPDVNESDIKFAVNKKGEVRYALSALKGVGANVVEEIVLERSNGRYNSIFDMAKRLPTNKVNKKSYESLVVGGAFDNFESTQNRAQYFALDNKETNAIEKAINFSKHFYANQIMNQTSLFADDQMPEIQEPDLPPTEEWSLTERLKKEKEVIGIYLSDHPLNDFKIEIEQFANATIGELENYKDREIKLAAIVSGKNERYTKKGTKFGVIRIEDYSDTTEFVLFSKDYATYGSFFEVDNKLLIQANYKKRYNSEDYELKIKKVEFLCDKMDEVRRIEVDVPTELITDNFNKDFNHLILENMGKVHLQINLIDNKKNYKIKLYSKSVKIDLQQHLLDWLLNSDCEFKIHC